MSLQRAITLMIGGIGVLWYYVCLFAVGGQWLTGPGNQSFHDFMSVSLTTIGVALATFIGILLGFRVVSDEVSQGVAEAQVTSGSAKLQTLAANTKGSAMQWAVAVLYVLSLLIALYFWWQKGDTADPAIINLGKSLLGLVGGALSVLLNVPRS
jgi:hypothetical protein